MVKSLRFLSVIAVLAAGAAHAQDLSGVASVNVTSETAAMAKNMALDEARRQIISDTLGKYSNADQLADLLRETKSADLMPLVAASGIDGERLSDTTYSANITIRLDPVAAKKWLNDNGVQNWLGNGTDGQTFITIVTFADGVADWIQLRQIARDLGIDFGAKYLSRTQATLELPAAQRARFTAAVRGGGWRYADQDGALRIWK